MMLTSFCLNLLLDVRTRLAVAAAAAAPPLMVRRRMLPLRPGTGSSWSGVRRPVASSEVLSIPPPCKSNTFRLAELVTKHGRRPLPLHSKHTRAATLSHSGIASAELSCQQGTVLREDGRTRTSRSCGPPPLST